MKNISAILFYAFLLLLTPLFSFGQEEVESDAPVTEELTEDTSTFEIDLDAINAGFSFDTGHVEIGDGIAYLDLTENFKFLNAEDSRMVLEDLWGNPPDESVMGMIFPKDIFPLDEHFTYAIEISFSDEGHVKDHDAEEIDYKELLEGMQEEAENDNELRREQGYPSVNLVGWASPPFYDKENKKLHWAKELAFEGEESNTLNYNIRVLGRHGYLNLNIIGGMEDLGHVKADIDEILGSVHFTDGNRYADFNPSLDKIAAYGIGGLIAGKVLVKAGILAKIGLFFAKFLKPILLGVVALFAAFRRRIFGGSSEIKEVKDDL